jgi:hypothetical protein
MPEPVVEPSPPEARELRLLVPLLAQEASYFAASASTASFVVSSMKPGIVRRCASFGRGTLREMHAARALWLANAV